ncbi:MAG: RDD family protein [Treponema sp.]|nr:RDD family protein [Treponema sp.]
MFDSSIKAITPEGVEFVLSPAGLPIRAAAYAIDTIFQYIILFAAALSYVIIRETFGVWLLYLLSFGVNWFYHVICELAFKGQSPGKRIMGIRVVRSDGSPVNPASSFLRNLLRFADTFFSFFHIAFISMSASRGFRRIGDWAGNTLVVYSSTARNITYSSLSYTLEKFEPVNPVRPLSSEEKQAVMDFARRYHLFGEARANEIAAVYAPYLKDENAQMSGAAYLMGIARSLSGELT